MDTEAITQAVPDVAINFGVARNGKVRNQAPKVDKMERTRKKVTESTGYSFTGPVAAIAGAGPALNFVDGTPAIIFLAIGDIEAD